MSFNLSAAQKPRGQFWTNGLYSLQMHDIPMTPSNAAVCFSPEDLDLFRDASGDRNPIHCSADYASRTVYGERLVYGVLGAIACLGHLDLRAAIRIEKLVADFHRPMFCRVSYVVRRIEDSRFCIRLMDGVLPVVTVTILTNSSSRKPFASTGVCQSDSYRKLSEPVRRGEDEIYPGLKISGRYHCDPTALAHLCDRWAVSVPVSSVQALLWGSYFTGMDLPGQSAVFFRLLLDFSGYQPENDTCEVLDYDALVTKVDPRLVLLCHKRCAPQNGQRQSCVSRKRARMILSVVIE